MSGAGKPVAWITRPQPGAARSAAAVEAMGFQPVVLPLTEIEACDPEIDIDDAERADCVAVTSGNAVRLTPKPLLDALKDRKVYTVGEATKAEALARGFSRVRSADGAVDDLVALICEHEKPDAGFVYLCGRRRTGDVEGKLRARGHCCLVAEVYSTNIVSHITYNIANALSGRGPDAILFHSALSARAFAAGTEAVSPQSFENTLFFCMSERVANALPDWAKSRARVAEAPNEAALLAALKAAPSAERA